MYTVMEFMPITWNGKHHFVNPFTSMIQWKSASAAVEMAPATRM